MLGDNLGVVARKSKCKSVRHPETGQKKVELTCLSAALGRKCK